MITVVDNRVSNVGSLLQAIDRIGYRARLATEPEDIERADVLILPGVGSFPDGMAELTSRGFVAPLHSAAKRGTAILGICLGMQLLMDESEEGGQQTVGLGLIPGKVKKLQPTNSFERVPNVGWCDVEITRHSDFTLNLPTPMSFYFTHSLAVHCEDSEDSIGQMYFGADPVTVMVQRDNVFGTQFHTEKSENNGLRLLENFVSLAYAVGENR